MTSHTWLSGQRARASFGVGPRRVGAQFSVVVVSASGDSRRLAARRSSGGASLCLFCMYASCARAVARSWLCPFEEAADGGCDFLDVGLQGEVTGVEEANVGLGDV